MVLMCTADRSRSMSTDDSLADPAAYNFSLTAKRAVSVECATLKPD